VVRELHVAHEQVKCSSCAVAGLFGVGGLLGNPNPWRQEEKSWQGLLKL